MAVVEVDHIGKVEHIVFDFPEGQGGVRIFTGDSATGKTTVLRALQALLGDADAARGLTPTDGHDKGEIVGLGRSVRIGKNVRTLGHVQVPSLRGRFDISVLVDPGVQDAAARKKARVRCLVALSGQTASIESLLGEHFEEYGRDLGIDEANYDDPVALADAVKRAIDAKALEKTRESDRLNGGAVAKMGEAGNVDELVEVESIEVATEAYKEAVRTHDRLESDRRKWKTATEHNAGLEPEIASLTSELASICGPSLDPGAIRGAALQALEMVDSARRALKAAEEEYDRLQGTFETALGIRASIERLQKGMVAVDFDNPTELDIANAYREQRDRMEALQSVSNRERRRAAYAEAQSMSEQASAAADASLRARVAAKRVVEAVNEILPSGDIEIRESELVVFEESRGKHVPLDELSTGQRWEIAIKYAIQSVGVGGVIALSQESWQSMGDVLQARVRALVTAANVWIVSGKVGSGPLRVE
jgi:hypothetical protein